MSPNQAPRILTSQDNQPTTQLDTYPSPTPFTNPAAIQRQPTLQLRLEGGSGGTLGETNRYNTAEDLIYYVLDATDNDHVRFILKSEQEPAVNMSDKTLGITNTNIKVTLLMKLAPMPGVSNVRCTYSAGFKDFCP